MVSVLRHGGTRAAVTLPWWGRRGMRRQRDPIETEANAIGEAMRTLRAEMGS
jgi:hypothetical protein